MVITKLLKKFLASKIHLKDLGSLKYFLGIEVARSSKVIFLNQQKYAREILSDTGLLECKPTPTPIEFNHHLNPHDGDLLPDPSGYRRLIGRLLYLTVTRPDITYVVNLLSQFISIPREPHLQAALRIVRYIKNSPDRGIMLHNRNSLRLHAYCDADWASCPTTRRSTTGYCAFLGTSPISWEKKKKSNLLSQGPQLKLNTVQWLMLQVKSHGLNYYSLN
ncbi:PREDICTED: uncharacterized protein LOC109153942 [Ipomoea nil]|uniref:uncharacterized protein LOC109153942 n=1 Tax=Ipomoea nil TaxID=35883 RepID=UPI000900C776|nr:PREDICTED: uncharacterized protein LOC109153942 [Ipomoea nil]